MAEPTIGRGARCVAPAQGDPMLAILAAVLLAADAEPPPSYPPDYLPPEAFTPRPPPDGEGGLPPEPAPQAVAAPRTQLGSPFWGALGVGGTFFGGELEPGVRVDRIFTPQLDVQLEGGIALTRRLGLALYMDLGIGGAGTDVRVYCRSIGASCSAETMRLGLLLRGTFAVSPRTMPWLGLGTGIAYGHVAAGDGGSGQSEEILQYWGWETLRVAGGVDFLRWPGLAVGGYASLSYILYSRYEDAGGALALPATSTHAVVQAGLRGVFFPP